MNKTDIAGAQSKMPEFNWKTALIVVAIMIHVSWWMTAS